MKSKSILLVFLLTLFSKAYSQDAIKSFLQKNNGAIDSVSVPHQLFDDSFYRSRYFLFGEIHGFSEPHNVDFALFSHLNKTINLKHYIVEMDVSQAWMINNFLADGNTKWLDKIFMNWANDGLQWANEEYYNKFIKLYELQKTLPENKKIRVIGIDKVQYNNIVIEHLGGIINKNKLLSKELEQLKESLRSGEEDTIKMLSFKLLTRLTESKTESTRLTKYEKAQLYSLLYSLSNSNKNREQLMFDNLRNQERILEIQNDQKYGLLGVFHCLQTEYNKEKPFAYILKQDLGGKGQITTFTNYFIDSKMLFPYMAVKGILSDEQKARLYEGYANMEKLEKYIPYPYSNNASNEFVEKLEQIEILEWFSKPNSVHLFKLTGKESPFLTSRVYGEVRGRMGLKISKEDGNTLDSFQYILLFRNTKPATPLYH